MFKLTRLGNKTVSDKYACLMLNKSNMSINTVAAVMLGANPGTSRIDVGIDNAGEGIEAYVAVFDPDGKSTEGRQLTKNYSFNGSSIQTALERFNVKKFEITESKVEFEGRTWYKLKPIVEEVVTEKQKAKGKLVAEVEVS